MKSPKSRGNLSNSRLVVIYKPHALRATTGGKTSLRILLIRGLIRGLRRPVSNRFAFHRCSILKAEWL